MSSHSLNDCPVPFTEINEFFNDQPQANTFW